MGRVRRGTPFDCTCFSNPRSRHSNAAIKGIFLPRSNSKVKARAIAYTLQGGRCFYCHVPMPLSDLEDFAARHGLTCRQALRLRCTAEHVIARCDGGSDCRSNIVAACQHCNYLRHARPEPMDASRYQTYVKARMSKRKWHGDYVFSRLLVAT
jgi:5-methylcytosine-specific restriction endonuclease McrA